MGRDYSSVPQELKNSSQWLATRLVPDPTPKDPNHKKKPPLSVHGGREFDVFNNPDHSNFVPHEDAVRSVLDGHFDEVGLCLTNTAFICVDGDNCFVGDEPRPWFAEFLSSLPQSYAERSISENGAHVWFRCDRMQDKPDGKSKDIINFPDGGKIELFYRGYLTVSGDIIDGASSAITTIPVSQLRAALDRVRPAQRQKPEQQQPRLREDETLALLLQGKIVEAGFSDATGDSEADLRLCGILAKKFDGNRELIEQAWLHSGLKREKTLRTDYRRSTIDAVLKNFKPKSHTSEIDPETWRESCYTFDQLPRNSPKYLVQGLIPEKALTLISAPSYNCKTWFAIALADAVAEGKNLWCFEGPAEPVPAIYHVPEMNAAFIRSYMEQVGVRSSENFLVRPMEVGLWSLDDPRMLRSSMGRLVVLDTAGYFNPADDTSNYQQSLRFSALVYALLNEGAQGVVGLYHPPKYSSLEKETVWTLENSILGSAGYGGILRSCLRMVNINPDLNDPRVHVYVQGLKNPGLKPFQLQGPLPLKMKLPPGESPYLSDILRDKPSDPRKFKAFEMFDRGDKRDSMRQQLKCAPREITRWRREWEEIRNETRLESQRELAMEIKEEKHDAV